MSGLEEYQYGSVTWEASDKELADLEGAGPNSLADHLTEGSVSGPHQ